MQKFHLYSAGVLLTVIIGLYSCTKNNGGIDNNQIIETPYSLFFSDTSGAVYSSNDGKSYINIYQPDGFPCRAICSQSNNIFLIKNYLYVSTNNGKNFSIGNKDVAYDTARSCSNMLVGLNQSMIINLPDWGRVYVATNNLLSSLGQEYTASGGIFGSWNDVDDYYDTTTKSGVRTGVGSLPVSMISYTRLTNGVLAGLAIQAPHIYRNFFKGSLSGSSWEECTGGPYGAPRDTSGIPLPSSGFFTLGHLNNQLIAIDATCTNGAYYSNDTGRIWAKYPGIPAGVSLLCICSPFEETCLIGSNSGLYVLDQNTGSFALNTSGLSSNIIVHGITYKENLFKNGNTQKYVYLATNKGIFQSSDGGNNWVLTIAGNFTAIY